MVSLLLLLAACAGPLPKGDPARPDIILVSIDSLRPDHLGSYGATRDTSPFLDKLAATGSRYTEARTSSPWTLPSHTTMLSGRGPLEHGVVEDSLSIPPTLPWLPEALSGAGYRTLGLVSTVYVSKLYGFHRGFEAFNDYAITEKNNLRRSVNAQGMVDEAIEWLAQRKDEPAFVFLHLYDAHYPYLPPEPFNYQFDKPGSRKSMAYRKYDWYFKSPIEPKRMEHLLAQYDECIAYVDAQLARLHEAYERSGRSAVWLVTADHGEEFGERGSWGHAHTLYPEVMRIPLIVSGPGVETAVRNERVQLVDVAPTLAAIAGVDFPSSGLDVRGTVPDRPQVFETSRFDSARLGYYANGERVDANLNTESIVRFDQRADPNETSELPAVGSALVPAMWSSIPAQWNATGAVTSIGYIVQGGTLAGHGWSGPGDFAVYPLDAPVVGAANRVGTGPPGVELSSSTREQLEALGYQQ